MSKIKRVLLIAPMVVCLFGLSSIKQQANSSNTAIDNTVNENISLSINSSISPSINLNVNPSISPSVDKKGKEQEPVFVDGGLLGEVCDSVEVIDIPPLFGFCGLTVVFGAGCGGDVDLDCVSGSSFCGGRITFHIECGSSQ